MSDEEFIRLSPGAAFAGPGIVPCCAQGACCCTTAPGPPSACSCAHAGQAGLRGALEAILAEVSGEPYTLTGRKAWIREIASEALAAAPAPGAGNNREDEPPHNADGCCPACGCRWNLCDSCGRWWYGTHWCPPGDWQGTAAG